MTGVIGLRLARLPRAFRDRLDRRPRDYASGFVGNRPGKTPRGLTVHGRRNTKRRHTEDREKNNCLAHCQHPAPVEGFQFHATLSTLRGNAKKRYQARYF